MSNLVIVAIPEENDLVWKISSEKVPHLTLLFLGEVGKVQNIDKILDFLEHAAKTTLAPFYLDVDYRGVLGNDEADVLFFKDGWELPRIKDFRAALLKNDAVFKAHVSEDQFPMWTPHLTLGYPDTPAKKLDSDRQIYSVCFDRIALWINDFDGPEFRLVSPNYYPEVSMSTPVDNILAHHGVKGMKWGRRKSDNSPVSVSVQATRKGKLKTSGGENQPAHEDAISAKVSIRKAKKSGVNSLSNEELQKLTTRLNLEQQVSKLAGDQMTSNGKKFASVLMDAAAAA